MPINESTIHALMSKRFDDYDTTIARETGWVGGGGQIVKSSNLTDNGTPTWEAHVYKNGIIIPTPYPDRLISFAGGNASNKNAWDISTVARRTACSKWSSFCKMYPRTDAVVWSDGCHQRL